MNQYKLTNRLLAGVAFLAALLTYALTLQPSVPFWDCGEFSAATTWQQVPHPPGAPLWLIAARVFQMLSFGDPGWRVNLAAATCSAFTALLVYLIGVRLVERWHPYREGKSLLSYLPTFGGALVASLSFTWSDSQWFNSVESEVYAGGMLLIALLVYLMMRWDQEAERPRHERYLLLMAYVLGLAIGVHLLALLVVPGVAMVIYFKRYRFNILTFVALVVLTGVIFFGLIYKAPLQYIPQLLASNAAIGILLLVALLGGVWWSVKNRHAIVYLSVTSFLLIILGYTTYTHVLLRASAHPPMNENEPNTFSELVAYLGRQQYGTAPNWPRRWNPDYMSAQARYDSGTGGRWSAPTGQDENGTPTYTDINTSGELNFMFSYQIDHMYLRYFFWNFVGRVSDIQDAPAVLFSVSPNEKRTFITPTGYDNFPIRFFALPLLLGLFGIYYHYRRDWKMAFTFTTLFLIMGVIAALQQNQQEPQPRERDYFYIGSFMIFASWIGIGATGLAETIRNRRAEEDAGGQETGSTGAVGGVLALCLVAVPINMAVGGWKLHDRSGNWIPWDYSYNILQSLDKNAILFTNGDNDTFPLWYLQDVAGVRRDVRVINLTLSNAPWYVWQLKHERPWKALQVPLSFDDSLLRVPEGSRQGLTYSFATPPTITLDVPAATMAWATDGKVKDASKMTWTLQGKAYGDRPEQLLRVQDKLIENIMENNGWRRPVYFSSTVGPDAWGGLEDYFRWEGMAYRVMPVKQGQLRSADAIDPAIMRASLMNTLGDEQSYTDQHYGFKFRNLTDRSVFYLEDHRQLIYNYRLLYVTLAIYEQYRAKNSPAAIATLDKLEQMISPDMFALSYPISAQIAEVYRVAGAKEKAERYARRTIALVDALGPDWSNVPDAQTSNPIDVKAQMYVALGDYDGAISTIDQLRQAYPGDPNVRARVEELRVERLLGRNDTAGAIAELKTIITSYAGEQAPAMRNNLAAFSARLAELTHTPAAPDGTRVDSSKAAPASK